VDIPPPPPPPPSPDDAPPSEPPSDAPTSSYAGLPPYPRPPYGHQGAPPYSGPGQPAYGARSQPGQQPSAERQPYPGQQPPPYAGQRPPPYGQGPAGPYGPPPPPGGAPYGGPPYGGANPYRQQQPYPGYPPPPGAWYPPPPPPGTNGMAIAALVTSLSCIPVLGTVFGAVGLRQIKRRGDRGKGMAVAGLVINSVYTVFVALFITLGVLGVFDDGDTRVDRIAVGQCFNTVGNSLSDYSGDGARSTTVNVVDCAEKHDAEAFSIFAVEPADGGGYPGVDHISAIAESKCASLADDYAAGVPWENSVDIYYYMPPADGWRRGDHSVTCFFGATHGRVTGSVKDGGPSSGFGV
jgi:hypothetical protein